MSWLDYDTIRSMFPISSTHPYGAPITNPAGLNNNCVATSLARHDSYERADELQERLMGYSQAVLPPDRGMFPDEYSTFFGTTGREYMGVRFDSGANQTAYNALLESPSATLKNGIAIYERHDGTAHSVNMYLEEGQTRPAFVDYQRSNFGERIDPELRDAKNITVYGFGAYQSPSQAEEHINRRVQLLDEGKMSVYEWQAGHQPDYAKLPSFESLHSHVSPRLRVPPVDHRAANGETINRQPNLAPAPRHGGYFS